MTMTQNEKPVTPAGNELSAEQVDSIGGGDCAAGQIVELTARLKEAYNNLVDFTSYVIERVAGGPPQ
jgi:hypothetical protein